MKKISLFILFVVVLGIAPAFESSAQNIPVTLNLQNVKLEQVLNDIEKQTNYLFVYNRNINVSRQVSVGAEQKNLREVLDQLFADTDINYSVEGTNIVLSQRAATPKGFTVTGKVSDQGGIPLAGVQVVAKETATGTVTDLNGVFTMQVDDNAKTLQFRYMGMKSVEMPIGTQRAFNVVMSDESVTVGEVVVTALGITKEARSLSYNVQSIASDEITTVKDASFINALAGKVAGMTLNASSSGIGGSTRVVLRGTKSLRPDNNNALYVIDGIPMPQLTSSQSNGDFYSGAGQSGDGIANFNPEDIESMSVLSGPAASALYGYEGANGVVVITTKKGSKEGLNVTLSNNTSFFSPFVMPKFQNTYGVSETGSYYSWGDKLEAPSSYNPKDFFQTGFNTTNNVGISVGNERNQTYLSVGSVTAQGIIPNNEFDRFNVTFRNTADLIKDKLTLDLSMMYAGTDEQNMISQGQYNNPLIPLYLFPPGDDIRKYQTYERYDAERFFKTQFWPFGEMGYGMQNPWWIVNRNLYQNHKDRYMIAASARFKVTDWFNITGRAKMDNNHSVNEVKYHASTWTMLARGSNKGFYSREDVISKSIYADVIGNFDWLSRCGCYSVSANIGASIRDSRYDQAYYSGGLKAPNVFSYMNVVSNTKILQERWHDQVQSVFATAQIGYGRMVYLDLTGRNDWDSRLAGTRSMSYFYPSVGLSTVATDLLGIDSKTFSFLKLRIAYAEVGNPPERWITQPRSAQSEGNWPNIYTYAPFDLQPERTRSWEAGFNLTLWNKLKLDATVYQSNTFNQVIEGALPPTSRYTGYYLNVGDVTNRGIEASLSLKQSIANVTWNTTAVFSLNRNKINKLVDSKTLDPFGNPLEFDRVDLGGNQAYSMYLYEGGTMSDLYVNGLEVDDHGHIYVNPANNSIRASTDPPSIYAGKMSPDYNLSWRNDFEWKGLDLGFMVSARVGGVGVSITQAMMDGFGTSEASARARDGQGDINVNGYTIPAYNYYSIVGAGQGVGAMYVYDATNVRLSEVYVGYTIPLGPRVSKVIKGLNVSLVGRNLLMIYNRAPFDPEITASTGTYFTGVDYFMQPSLRNLGFSTRLTF